jgi:hypothetical protein
MAYDVFPIDSLWPNSCRWWRANASYSGGVSESGLQRFAVTSGGGAWNCAMTIPLVDDFGYARAKVIKLARAMVEATDGGANPLMVPFIADNEAPYPLGAPAGDVGFSDGSDFSDGSGFMSGTIDATLGAAALRSTELTLTGTAIGALDGGEMFSIAYPTKGEHMHTIIRVGDGSLIKVRPPTREAIVDGTSANFDRPRCLMILTNADAALEAITPPYQSVLTLNFRESL